MIDDELNALMAKALTGEATPEEAADLQAWAERDATVARAWKQAQALWEKANSLPQEDIQEAVNVDAAWQSVHRRMHPREVPMRVERGGLLRRNWSVWAVAASAVLALSIYWLLLPSPTVELAVISPNLKEQVLLLKDGSEVTVPVLSTIRLDTASFLTDRVVRLDERTVLFHVAKRNGQPFVVETGLARVRVLGTKFVVDRVGNRTVVGVQEGRVRVTRLNQQGLGLDSVELTAGQSAIVDESALYQPTEMPQEVAWGMPQQSAPKAKADLKFQDESLGEASAELSKVFGRPVVVDDSTLAGRRVTAVYRQKTLVQVLAVWRELYGLDTVRRGDTVILKPKP